MLYTSYTKIISSTQISNPKTFSSNSPINQESKLSILAPAVLKMKLSIPIYKADIIVLLKLSSDYHIIVKSISGHLDVSLHNFILDIPFLEDRMNTNKYASSLKY
jgi:hypothetical protein